MAIDRVTATAAAAEMIRKLKSMYGDLMFHQSGGCCDGSSPMCYPLGEFKTGERDICLGSIEGCPFYISGSQYELWKHPRLTIDIVKGRGSGFSLEAPEDVRFLTRSRVFTEEEVAALETDGLLSRGPRQAPAGPYVPGLEGRCSSGPPSPASRGATSHPGATFHVKPPTLV